MHPNLDEITKGHVKRLEDDGKLIEAGWVSLEAMSVPATTPPIHVAAMRQAFFVGALHLFGSMAALLADHGDEPSDDDLRRMESIRDELNSFAAAYMAGRSAEGTA